MTTTQALINDGQVRAHISPFGLPIGLKGRLAGWYMAIPDRQHRELTPLVPLDQATSLLEIGFGPGSMLRGFRRDHPDVHLMGVDPSEVMVTKASRCVRAADLRLGAAGSIPFGDGSADVVLAVNNLPMWPDLDAALVEIRRVLHPGGHLLIAWHGGAKPVGHQRKLILVTQKLREFDTLIADHFPTAHRRTLEHSELWTTTAAGMMTT